MATSIAIRLGVEGGAELKRVLDDAGSAGQAAFQKVGAAADQAAAATDRQTAKWQRLAQAAREAEAQARAQANVNAFLGVGAGSAGAARDSASVFEAEMARQDQIRAARQEQSARTAQANINTLLGVRDAQVGAARASASAFEDAYRAETDALRRTAEARTTIIRSTVAGWRDLGASGAATLANIEAGRRLGSLNNVPEAANQNRRLRSDEVTNLMYQGGDIAAQLGSGSPLSMIAMQQGPQIAQIFAGPGGASVKGAFAQAGEAVGNFVTKIGPVGLAFGGLAVATGVGLAALISYRSGQAEVEKALSGVGRASGATQSSINALAEAQSQAGAMGRRSARDIASAYAGTGRIDASLLGGAVSATPDFAKFLGVDRSEGATELAGSLSDVSRGATELAERYGLLTDAQAESIRRMDAQGDRLGAQRRLLDAVRDSTRGLAEATTGWGRATEWLSDRWDDLGRGIDRAVTGGDLDTRLKTARDALADARKDAEGSTSIYRQVFTDPQIATFEADVRRLEKLVQTRDAVSEQVQRGRRSQEVGSLIRSLDPDQEQLKKLTDQGMLLRRAITDPIRFGLSTEQIEAAKRAFGDVSTVVKNLVADVDQFGSRAVAALNRSADASARLVGATGFGRSAADINQRFDEQLRDAKEADRAGIERARRVELDTLTRSQSLDLTQRGGAFGRAPSEIQQMVLAASQRFPTVPPEILAAIGEKENGFRLSGPTNIKDRFGNPASTAWGYGQITVGAEEDIRKLIPGFDRKDPSQAVMGAAAYLSLRQQWAGGDQIKALNGYGTGPGYGLDIMRRAGQLGDVSSLSLEREQDARNRALQQERDALRLTTEAGGRDREGTLARIEAMKAISDAAARGIPVSQAYAAQLGREASERQRILTTGRLFQFANDNAFDREQLGRTQIDAAAFARARSTGLDPSDPRFAGVVEASRLNDGLRETKSLANEAFGGMLSDLRQSTSLVSTLGNLTNRVADRLFSIAADRTISSLFTGTGGTSGEGPFGAVASYLFGGAKADGGLLAGPGGPRSDNLLIRASPGEYVINAASVSHYGPGFFDSLNNRAMARFADGGLIGREAFTTPRSMPMQAENANASSAGVTLNVINQVPGLEVQKREVSDGRGGRREEMVIVEAVASATRHPLVQSAQSRPRVAAR